ncbi:MAG: carboxypeptidase regulatory-like domain-containing protein [Ardenticatenaceae bacterium]|nr:carboxypeptidase regulatory-like domain-containing protein [Ardenticatenaceae bacterium]MCB9442676.1 carboxypeptidase regulatory-like domain-containing protein [Ardenticatenaceae bacterium]
MEDIEKRLAAQLYRVTCPTPTELGEYHLHLISGTQADTIRQHLHICPHCQAELSQLQAYLTDLTPDVERSLSERVQIWIARLIPAGTMGGGALQPALALRGQDDGPLMYEAGAAQLTLEVQDDPEKVGARAVLGLLIGVETVETVAHLWQNAQKTAQIPVDEIGNFTFTGLAPGRYELIVSGPDFEIHVQELVV